MRDSGKRALPNDLALEKNLPDEIPGAGEERAQLEIAVPLRDGKDADKAAESQSEADCGNCDQNSENDLLRQAGEGHETLL